mmetsp:Transcript_2729/g.7545  ORF Transcript_2729/g.7545 Transcript_2729/m.7545 type:complete len:206 (+) Transcript_2729:1310-1927(+)
MAACIAHSLSPGCHPAGAVLIKHEARERDRREVAHGHLVRRRVLDDLRAQVGAPDGTEVLLVGLAVGCVLVEHIRRPRLNLGFDDFEPKLLGRNDAPRLALALILFVQRLKVLPPAVDKPGALVRAEERPAAILLDAAHEEVAHPERVEQIARARLLLAVVLAKLEELKDIRMPRLEVDGERALALAAALVDVACGRIKDTKHRH